MVVVVSRVSLVFTFGQKPQLNNNDKNNPHLNFVKGAVLGDKEQGAGIRDKEKGSGIRDKG